MDVIVIGGGWGGVAAALEAASLLKPGRCF